MNRQSSPYACHVFVCVNDRQGERKACADGMSPEIKDYIKEQVDKLGLKGKVRVSNSGCLGLCTQGPNVMLYPQGIWFSDVTLADADAILAVVREAVAAGPA